MGENTILTPSWLPTPVVAMASTITTSSLMTAQHIPLPRHEASLPKLVAAAYPWPFSLLPVVARSLMYLMDVLAASSPGKRSRDEH